MRRYSTLASLLSLATLSGVAGCTKNVRHITTSAVLGRVVIYRNGVAFYERTAKVVDGRVSVLVPRDRVDDFLKSLTVVDPQTRKPIAVSIPRQESDSGSYLTMSLETDRSGGEVLLTYVTESPAWKPSYRVVVGAANKVMLEGWAVVDNVSGEDWRGVLVGVGASSALSFRYDLWSVRRIDRDLLQGEDRFAVAPPTGMSPYAETASGQEIVSLDASEVRDDVALGGDISHENRYVIDGVDTTGLSFDSPGLRGNVSDKRSKENLAGVTVVAQGKQGTETAITDERGNYSIANLQPGQYTVTFYYGDTTYERTVHVGKDKPQTVDSRIDVSAAGGETVKITATAPTIDPTSTSQGYRLSGRELRNIPAGRTFSDAIGSAPGLQSDGGSYEAPPPPPPPIKTGDAKLGQAAQTIIKNKQDVLIKAPGSTVELANKRATAVKNKLVDDGIPASRIHISPIVGTADTRIRVLAIAPSAIPTAPPNASARAAMPDTPVGESHFIAERPMNVRAGTSAMVSMVQAETSGGIVYLYDPISDRGDERFAFKAVRLDNPTNDTLEPGPVTVYGEGRFIGEGITEPVPPKASVVVPFALDRQVVISRNTGESDRIAKLVTVQRGILTAEVQHRRDSRFTVTSRLQTPSKVYLRHRLESGWKLVEGPPKHMTVGDSQLFEIDLAPGETKYVTISEATPVERRIDLASDHALDMMKVYLDEPAATPELKAQVTALLATHRSAADLVDQIATLRDQLAEYRQRAGELHAQVVTLKAVRTSGELMAQLKTRLAEINTRMQKATIAIVDAQEKLMLTRVRFQNQLADLKLVDVTVPAKVSTR